MTHIHISGHAWRRFQQRFPERNFKSARHLQEHINSNTKSDEKLKAINGKSEKILRCGDIYIPVTKSSKVQGHLVAKTIIPKWLMEENVEQLKQRITVLENIIWGFKYTRKKRFRKWRQRLWNKFKHRVRA